MPALAGKAHIARGHKLVLGFGWRRSRTHPAKRLAQYSVGWENAPSALRTLRIGHTDNVSGVKALSASEALAMPRRVPNPSSR